MFLDEASNIAFGQGNQNIEHSAVASACEVVGKPEISKQLYSVLERLMTSEKILTILSCNGMDSISTVLDDMREMRKVTMSDTRMCNMLKVSMNMGVESYSTL